jgi:hypothetical protein
MTGVTRVTLNSGFSYTRAYMRENTEISVTSVTTASELSFLRQMTPDELRRRYAEKLAFGGGWIRNHRVEALKAWDT